MTGVPVPEQHTLTRDDVRRLIRKYLLLVLLVFLSGTLAMWAALPIFFTDLYESKVRLLVKLGRENTETPGVVQHGQVMSQGVRMADINSEVQLLSSRILVEAAVDRLGPEAFRQVLPPPRDWTGYPKYYAKKTAREVKRLYREFLILASLKKRLPERDNTILALAAGVKVEPVKDSDILVLKVRTPAAKLSVDVANVLLETYLSRRAAVRQTSAGAEFFASRLAEASQTLNQSQQARAAVRARWTLDAPQEQRALELQRLSAMENEMVQNEADIARLERQRKLVAERLPQIPELVSKEQVDSSNPSIQSMKDRITALKVERAKVASRYQPDSEVVRKVDAEIADLESVLAREPATILQSLTRETDPRRKDLRSSLEQMSVQIAGLTSRNAYLRSPALRVARRVKELTAGLDALEAVEREYRRAEQDYLFYSKRLEEARMSEELDSRRVANVVAAEKAETPLEPATPNRMFIMGIAMAVSLVLGIAFAAWLETTEDRLQDEAGVLSVGDVAYLGTMDLREAS